VSQFDWQDDSICRAAKLNGKLIYKSGYECSIMGHGRKRYVKGRGCVVCADQRRARKIARADLPQRTGRSATREYRLWQGARQRAEQRGLEFTITIDDIRIPTHCPVFGTPLSSPSLDRFDNDRGYTPENIRVISRRANTIKSDARLAEIVAIANYMMNFDDIIG
jgi:hypothetical protein